MGEVRIKVKLTNASDEDLCAGRRLPRAKVRGYEADAIVDTGAVRSIVPAHVVQKLGVRIRGNRVAEYADGRKEPVGVTSGIVFDILGRDTLEEALVLGDEVLIGQTVLEKLDLWVDSASQRVFPNPAHPDQPVSKVRQVSPPWPSMHP